MDVTAAMVAFALEQQGSETRLWGNPTCAVEYARTLVCYLRNSQNATHTADELFIHRTSFMRRMAHMKDLAPFDLDDPDEALHLLLSAKLLDL